MGGFVQHTVESAPEGSSETLEAVEAQLGFVPNLFRTLAESPAALGAYLSLNDHFEQSSFSPTEQQIVLLTTAFENRCHYCMAAHTAVAGMQDVPQDVVHALREGEPISDGKLETLRSFTRTVVRERGWVPHEDVAAFLGAGYEPRQVLEVILGVAQKTLSNYVNHLAETPVDDQFSGTRWTHPRDREAGTAPSGGEPAREGAGRSVP